MRLVITGLIILLLAVGIYAYREYNRKPADLSGLAATERVSASELAALYSTDEESADKKYLGKVVEVSGLVMMMENEHDTALTIFLGDSMQTGRISCLMDKNYIKKMKKIMTGYPIKIKGICTGYLMDVELNRCVIVKE